MKEAAQAHRVGKWQSQKKSTVYPRHQQHAPLTMSRPSSQSTLGNLLHGGSPTHSASLSCRPPECEGVAQTIQTRVQVCPPFSRVMPRVSLNSRLTPAPHSQALHPRVAGVTGARPGAPGGCLRTAQSKVLGQHGSPRREKPGVNVPGKGSRSSFQNRLPPSTLSFCLACPPPTASLPFSRTLLSPTMGPENRGENPDLAVTS